MAAQVRVFPEDLLGGWSLARRSLGRPALDSSAIAGPRFCSFALPPIAAPLFLTEPECSSTIGLRFNSERPLKLIRGLRKQAWGWRFFLLVGFLLFGTYLVFDVLDIDGSKLPSELSSNTLATLESPEADAERLLRLGSSALSSPSRLCFLSIPQALTDSEPSVICSHTRMVAAHNPRTLARVHVRREIGPSSTPTADPA